jgi:hypothetical protein
MGKPLVYRFDNIGVLRYLTGYLSKDIQTHKAWLNRGKWNAGPKNSYYHGQFEKTIPIAIYSGPWAIDEILVEGNWKL